MADRNPTWDENQALLLAEESCRSCPKQTMGRRKKIRRFEAAAVDRISECPDSVLVHILSLLSTVDAVKTQVLSKRWRFLWTFLPSLRFRSYMSEDSDDEDFVAEMNNEFVAFVDKTLSSSNGKLKKLEVEFEYERRLASNVDWWTRFAAIIGVEELRLQLRPLGIEVHDNERYELPQLLYGNSWFKELHFSWCRVIPKGNVAWYFLKKLSIGDVKLSNDVIERILAGSPVLETLELHFCEGFSRLAVTNSCLKKLILRVCLDGNDSELEILAPYLLSLDISGCFWRSCRFMNVSSLVDAVFNCSFAFLEGDRANDYERCQNLVGGLLASLLHVKNLTLGTWALEVLSIMEAKGLSSPMFNCKCLTFDTEIDKYVLPGIANVLKSTPNVEALIMTCTFSSLRRFGFRLAELCNYNGEHYWTSQKWNYKCLTPHLKSVSVAERLMIYCCDSNFFSFIQFLLRNARVLQKMVISKPQKKYFKAAQKLLSFPRSSPDAVVIFY
ncbi:putative F-box protein At1g49610 [Rhododendron vialii]|uniref:putative F-box protein At1g49610 n=1 Tax=Rhododendron vialii TaxID=182163 RepID=UPI00265FA0C8|nr:putative F-box protein At1g49610 [Rhododendron vialii]